MIAALSTEKPWQAIDDANRIENPVPSMIAPDEFKYLRWLARDLYSGKGEIVDGGPLLGGSTVALAEGLRQNPRVREKARRVHSYDRFVYIASAHSLFPDASRPKPGDSVLTHFLDYTEPWREHLAVYPGEIQTHGWAGEPIEILFIDLAKTWATQGYLLREFFPSLIPGVSIVVQQDYFFHGCYWIHPVMEHLADYFTPVHVTDASSAGFLLERAIPPELLEIDYEHHFSRDEALALMDGAAGRYTGAKRLQVLTAKAAALVAYGEHGAALDVLETIRCSSACDQTVSFDWNAVFGRLPSEVAIARGLRPEPVTSTYDGAVRRLACAAAEGRPVYVWGAGAAGRALVDALRAEGTPIAGIIDSDPCKHGHSIHDLTVVAPQSVQTTMQPLPYFGIATLYASEVVATLARDGWGRDSFVVVASQ